MTLVSVITPTWQRHDLLIGRCIPSVRAQTHLLVEHIVVSDGPDPHLWTALADEWAVFVEMPEHDPHPSNYGSAARNVGLDHARGDYIAYLDDDNAWRPDHLTLLVRALEDNPAAGFAYSQLVTHPNGLVIGSQPPAYCGLDTSVIVHRRELADVARWPHPDQIDGDPHAPDWAVVAAWLAGGAGWVHVPVVTVDYHFPQP